MGHIFRSSDPENSHQVVTLHAKDSGFLNRYVGNEVFSVSIKALRIRPAFVCEIDQ